MISARYLQVAKQLLNAINSGVYPAGTLLPTEHELSDIYQVSRHTIRAAIARLQEQGLVSRKKKVGTRVESSSLHKGYSQSLASVSDLVLLAETQQREIKEVEYFTADIGMAGRLQLIPGGKYIRISSIRIDSSSPDKPICWTDVYIQEEYESVIPLARDRRNELIAAIIEAEMGCEIYTIEQSVEAVLLTEKLAEELNASGDQPALQITRVYSERNGEVMALSVTVHPKDRFTLTTRMVREKPISLDQQVPL
ncbi:MULTISPECIES: GntR family transcriptional regulator [unclassified Pantoea]|uniref:GntR family transcriptional regulator n=1 Tax=unclassified Pantoea TaxID=2630326 RepID=UPI001CD72820|nr:MULTISPECIES: GntR family transcriptional regulator [unclassified Pantoea]MCA1179506.1 GntR family transcriptional regulator [Pantoea sp. alder69]MCA1251759.1 GntR family transcriptional regulator [Pantoea sp. alder70]MCA1267904.1 GntR family transcriptional regulator [Pantoea sp. alder81]